MPTRSAPTHSAWSLALTGAAGACALAGLVLWPTALELAASWQKSESYHYAWLVLPMFVYLVVWHYRDELLAERPQADASGIVLAGLAAICWSVAAAANIDIGRQLALILVIQGIVLSAVGRRLYRRWFSIMGLLFLLLPSADLLLYPLRLLTLKAIEGVALLCRLPYRNDEFFVEIGDHSYLVLDACAGLSHVTLTLFIGYCFALLIYRSIYKIIALTLFTALLGVASNVLRVSVIVWLDWIRGYQMNLAAHGRIQWLALSLVLGILFYVLLRLRADAAAPIVAGGGGLPPSRLDRSIPMLAGAAVLVIAGLSSLRLNSELRSPFAESIAAVPAAIVGWEIAAPSASALRWSSENGRRSLTLSYRRQQQSVRVMIVEALSPGLKLHETQLTPPDQALYRDVWRGAVSACAEATCARFGEVISRRDQAPNVRHLYYRYAVGAYRTPLNLGQRAATALFRLLGRNDSPRLVGFSVEGDALPLDELAGVERALETALARVEASGGR